MKLENTAKTNLLGAAGEHHVMSELLRRGYVSALAPQGVPNTDLVVTDLSGQRLCSIQVKSRQDKGRDGGWHMSKKHESIIGDRLFYCFVNFGNSVEVKPSVYVMPSAKVASVLTEAHIAWVTTPGNKGQQRKNTDMRRLVPDYDYAYKPNPNKYPLGWMDQYRNAWHLLGLDN